jgi:AbiTii
MKQMQCIAAWKEIPKGAVVRLLDSVKTKVLGFAIDLEREAPAAGDSPIGSHPAVSQEKMTQIFNTNIAGNVANLSNSGSDFSQISKIAVDAGDWDSLRTYFERIGLSDEDLEGLKVELDIASREQHSESDPLEGKTGSWIGKLAAKAAKGAAGVSLEVAAAGIAKAIAAYLGLPYT